MWIAGSENAIEGEVGSSNGGRNNDIMLDTSGDRGPVEVDTTLVSGGGNFGLDSTYESTGGEDGPSGPARPPRPARRVRPSYRPRPRPRRTCPAASCLPRRTSRRSAKSGPCPRPHGWKRCLSACVPSRCCLVSAGVAVHHLEPRDARPVRAGRVVDRNGRRSPASGSSPSTASSTTITAASWGTTR